METRKVQLTGSSTYTISLPKQWASEQGIEPGQRLALCPRDSGTLVVGADRAADTPAPVVDVGGESPEEIRRTVRALYTLGYDEFGFRSADGVSTAMRRSIADATGALTGLEIVVENDTEIRCRDLLDTGEISLERVVSRLQFVALSAHRDATAALLDGDGDRITEIERDRQDAIVEYAVVERYFQRTLTDVGELDRLGVTRQAVLDYLRVAEQLDRISRLAIELAELAEFAGGAPDDANASPGSGGEPAGEPTEPWAGAFSDHAQRVRLLVESATSAALSEVTPAEVRQFRDEYRACLDDVRSLRVAAPTADVRTPPLAVDNLERAVDCGRRIGERAHQAALRRIG